MSGGAMPYSRHPDAHRSKDCINLPECAFGTSVRRLALHWAPGTSYNLSEHSPLDLVIVRTLRHERGGSVVPGEPLLVVAGALHGHEP